MRPLSLFLVLTACGTSSLEVSADEAAGQSGRGLELWAPDCAPYPYAIDVGASGEAAARAELAAISPGAVMSWSATRNTPATIFSASFTFECEPGKDAREQWFAYVAQHPALFRIDPSEWHASPVPCEAVSTSGSWLNAGRATFAGQPVRADVFAWYWRAVPKGVRVEAVAGTWVPVAQYNDVVALGRCADLDVAGAEKTTRNTKLTYRTFNYCAPTGDYTYGAAKADVFSTAAGAVLEWSEDSGKVLVQKTHGAKLVLDPSSWTPELISSDANCPLPGGTPNIGFELVFDAVTGRLLQQKPGVGCIVCLTP